MPPSSAHHTAQTGIHTTTTACFCTLQLVAVFYIVVQRQIDPKETNCLSLWQIDKWNFEIIRNTGITACAWTLLTSRTSCCGAVNRRQDCISLQQMKLWDSVPLQKTAYSSGRERPVDLCQKWGLLSNQNALALHPLLLWSSRHD